MSALAATPLDDVDYHARTDAILKGVESQIDAWLDGDVIDIDTHRTGGLLELSFPNRSKIIINTQPPLQELWVAAKAGGFHFRFVDGRWVERGGREFHALLSDEASAQGGRTLRFENPSG